MPTTHPRRGEIIPSLLTGVIGGVVGTFAMALSQRAITSIAGDDRAPKSRRLRHAGVGKRRYPQSEPRSHERALTTSELLVDRLATHLGSEPLTQARRAALGSFIHFTFGATVGAAYLLATRQSSGGFRKFLTAGRGTLYGTIVWIVADELGIPLTGLAPPPHRTPARLHAYALASHLAYGFALDQTSRLLQPR